MSALGGEACGHGGGTAYVDSVCLFCGERRKRGRPARHLALVDAFKLGAEAASAAAEPEGVHTARREARVDAAITPFKPSWLRADGRLKKAARNPPAYKREPEADTGGGIVGAVKREVAMQEKLRATRERLGRLSLAEFIKLGWHVINPGVHLYWNWHMQAVADHMQKMLEELLKARRDPTYQMTATNLMINIPPRSAKSMIVSVFFSAWAWLHDPTLKIKSMSCNGDVAGRDSRYARDLIGSEWYRETFRIKWDIRSDIDGVEQFANTERGTRLASTFQARVTGTGTDIIIVDDPHDAEEVNSDAMRAKVLTKWDTAIESRVEDPLRCLRIGVMQRLHEADWAGHVLESGTWIHLFIPMEYEPERPCSTRIGDWTWSDPRKLPQELLQPERFPLRLLRGGLDPNGTGGKYKVLGGYGYAGQMQQRPAPADGGMFKRKWWRWYDEAPSRFDGLILSVDCNAKKTINGSRTSLLLVGRKGPQRFILDNDTRITDIEETVQAIIDMRKKWPDVTMTIVEDKANGPSVVSMLKKRIGRIEEQKVGSDSKESRARAIAPLVEAGDVFLPRNAPWLDDFMHELSMFPNGARDDQVDALSQALIYMEGSNEAARLLDMLNG